MVWYWLVSGAEPIILYSLNLLQLFLCSTILPFLFFLSIGWYCRAGERPSTAPDLGVCKWSPEGLEDKSVSLIPNTAKILKLVKKKMN